MSYEPIEFDRRGIVGMAETALRLGHVPDAVTAACWIGLLAPAAGALERDRLRIEADERRVAGVMDQLATIAPPTEPA